MPVPALRVATRVCATVAGSGGSPCGLLAGNGGGGNVPACRCPTLKEAVTCSWCQRHFNRTPFGMPRRALDAPARSCTCPRRAMVMPVYRLACRPVANSRQWGRAARRPVSGQRKGMTRQRVPHAGDSIRNGTYGERPTLLDLLARPDRQITLAMRLTGMPREIQASRSQAAPQGTGRRARPPHGASRPQSRVAASQGEDTGVRGKETGAPA